MIKILFLQPSEQAFTDSAVLGFLEDLPSTDSIEIADVDTMEQAQNILDEAEAEYVICSSHLAFSAWDLYDYCIHDCHFILEGSLEEVLTRECIGRKFSGHLHIHTPRYDITVQAHPKTYFNASALNPIIISMAFSELMAEPQSCFSLDMSIYYSLIFAQAHEQKIAEHHIDFFADIADITPRQLLTHTSGIRDLEASFEARLALDHFILHRLAKIKSQPRLNFEYYYTEYSYSLLALAIEAYTGNFYLYLQNKLWQPHQLESSFYAKGLLHRSAALPELKNPKLPSLKNLGNINEIDHILAQDYYDKLSMYQDKWQERQDLIDYFYQGFRQLDDGPQWSEFVAQLQVYITELTQHTAEDLLLLQEIQAFIDFYTESMLEQPFQYLLLKDFFMDLMAFIQAGDLIEHILDYVFPNCLHDYHFYTSMADILKLEKIYLDMPRQFQVSAIKQHPGRYTLIKFYAEQASSMHVLSNATASPEGLINAIEQKLIQNDHNSIQYTDARAHHPMQNWDDEETIAGTGLDAGFF